MRLRFILVWGIVLVLLMQSGCDVPTESATGGPAGTKVTNIRGTIVRSDNLSPIAGAFVFDAANIARDTSKADGSFLLKYFLTTRTALKVFATRTGYASDTLTLSLDPGRDTTVTRQLVANLITAPPTARQPAQIAFVNVTTPSIFVSGVGATENTILTYEVRDSLGTPIDKAHRALAVFTLQFFPNTFVSSGTAPRLIPSADSTDDVGRVRVSLSSGTTAGVVQTIVSIVTPTGTIKSQPVRVTISSGFPDQKHFTLTAEKYNFAGLETVASPPGFVNSGKLAVWVQVSDRYSNPVQSGTAVYFNTQHGSIETVPVSTGVPTTGPNGFLVVTLLAGNPYPQAPNAHPTLGPGYSYVYARTLGENNTLVIDSLLMLWTGIPIITKTDPNNTFTIGNGGSAGPFTFTVADKFGHPMSAGTIITVDGPGLTISGDVSTTINDTFATGPGITSFSVVIADADGSIVTVPPTVSVLTIRVQHPIYGPGTFKKTLASGTVQ